jgi:hypothetical protein
MTFRHLADMRSGYACNDRDGSGNLLPPGSRWAYNDYAIMLYIKTLDKVFGTTDNLVTAGNQRFVVPLQFEDGVLFNSAKGRVKASARDFARMGWFWLNRGQWKGTQLLPSRFFDDYMKADVPYGTLRTTNNTADDYLGVGSYGGGINQHDGQGIYGFNWWFNQCLIAPPRVPPLLAWPTAPADTYMASGHFGKECMAMIPSLGMVVAAYNTSAASWGDTVVTDPPTTNGTLNQNLKLLTESVQPQPPGPSGVILASADVVYSGTDVYNAYSQSQQINWGLAASDGVAAATGRRSFLVFTLGSNAVATAKLKLWNYWGGPTVNGQGRLPEATTRIYGALTNMPLTISEPPPSTHATVPGYVAPDNTNFFVIASDQTVGPGIGWYEWDITGWYNACLGQTTTVMLRASATSGYDFPLYEDREGTASGHGAGGTIGNSGPRIEFQFPPPQVRNIRVAGGSLIISGCCGTAGSDFVLVTSTRIDEPQNDWMRVTTNQFDAAGTLTLVWPLAPGATQTFYRLLLK